MARGTCGDLAYLDSPLATMSWPVRIRFDRPSGPLNFSQTAGHSETTMHRHLHRRWQRLLGPTALLACWLTAAMAWADSPLVRLPSPLQAQPSREHAARAWSSSAATSTGHPVYATDDGAFAFEYGPDANVDWPIASDAATARGTSQTSAYVASSEPALDFNLEPEAPVETERMQTAPADIQRGFLQQIRWTNTYLAGGGADGMGMYDTSLQGTVAFPFFTTDAPMLITPGFTTRFLDGPQTIDMPARLYDAFVEIRHIRWLTPTLATDLAVTPGYYGDYEQDLSEAFRLTGRGLVLYDISPDAKLIAGVAYLNRDNLKLLPVGGLIWNPTEVTKFELIMPQPRIARRFNCCGPVEWWGYLAGEFGGGVWAIERQDGSGDRVTYNDLRFMLGIERKNARGNSVRLEAGYVFDRELVYLDGTTVDLDDTVMARGILAY